MAMKTLDNQYLKYLKKNTNTNTVPVSGSQKKTSKWSLSRIFKK